MQLLVDAKKDTLSSVTFSALYVWWESCEARKEHELSKRGGFAITSKTLVTPRGVGSYVKL